MSSSSTATKFEKEKIKLIQEKCQGLLNEMLRDEDNKYCVDCDAKGPRWASWNLGIFLCIRCAGIHRNLGVHISRVKSVNLDTWTPEQVVTMQSMGNSRARAVYEANMPDNFRRPQTDVALENFIRAKYEHKKYIAQEFIPPSIPKINWDSEIEDSLRKKKEAKKQGTTDISSLPNAIPKPKPANSFAASKTLPTSASVASAQPLSSSTSSNSVLGGATSKTTAAVELNINGKSKNPSDDLLGLMTNTESLQPNSNIDSDPFASPIKSTPNTNSNVDDLGGIFMSPPDANSSCLSSNNSSQKMTKESILSLYGSSTTNNATGNPNPFTSSSMYSTTQNSGGGIGGNPFPQYLPQQQQQQHHQQQFNPNAGGMLTDNSGGGLNNLFNFQSADTSQIQQQMYGLSFNTVPHTNNSAVNLGNNLIGNYSQMGQAAGVPPFLGLNSNNSTPFQSQPQVKNPGRPFF